jgi:hypothetical protein
VLLSIRIDRRGGEGMQRREISWRSQKRVRAPSYVVAPIARLPISAKPSPPLDRASAQAVESLPFAAKDMTACDRPSIGPSLSHGRQCLITRSQEQTERGASQ